MATEKIKYPLKNKLIVLVLVAMVPILYVTIYLILALVNYSRAYDQIVNSMLKTSILALDPTPYSKCMTRV